MCYDSVYDSTLLIYVHVHVSMPSTEFRVRYLPYTTECDMTGLYLGRFTVQKLTDSQIKSSTRSRKQSLILEMFGCILHRSTIGCKLAHWPAMRSANHQSREVCAPMTRNFPPQCTISQRPWTVSQHQMTSITRSIQVAQLL